ncbi:hypothetical protein [Sessilibacter sp. MAH4]
MSDSDFGFYRNRFKFNLTEKELNELPLIPKGYPLKIREALEELFNIIDFKSEAEKGYWAKDELKVIKLLTQTPTLKSFYAHLNEFDLESWEIQRILLEVFLETFQEVEDEREKEEDLILAEDNYHQSIAEAAYRLFGLLQHNENNPEDSKLSKFLGFSFLQTELMGLISSCTSAKWPELYWHHLLSDSDQYINGLDRYKNKVLDMALSDDLITPETNKTPTWADVDIRRFEEMPELYKVISEFEPDKPEDLEPLNHLSMHSYHYDNVKFPPPTKANTSPYTSKINGYQFIEIALKKLDDLSHTVGRFADPIKKENGKGFVIDGKCRLFLRNSDWVAIGNLLFGIELQRKSVEAVLRRHKKYNNNNA